METPLQSCPFSAGPAPVTDIPERIAKLPKKGGWPVPWFVDKVNGEYDFRVMDGEKMVRAVKGRLCWTCGEPMGRRMSFVLGPMCGITRTNGEPPSHRGCAEYAAKHCPFLTRPGMKRREDEITDAGFTAGVGLKRNPGCCAVWTTTSYKPFKPPGGGVLFTIGDPLEVDWYAEGRPATRAEVLASVESGLPILRESCDKERYRREAHQQLDEAVQRFMQLLPKPAVEFLNPNTREPQPDISRTGVLVINDRAALEGGAAMGEPSPHLGGFVLLKNVPPGTCEECAVEHDAASPHNNQSLHYQYQFKEKHGRWPTWADAMAHCSTGMKAMWIKELAACGITVEGGAE